MKTITNGATIIVVSTGKCYHTLRDWGLAIGNNNCIGDPVLETFYLDVPGADGILDYSEALTGRPIYKYRPIEIVLGGKKTPTVWPGFMSTIRSLIHGQTIHVVFDDFPGYYWKGRAEITGFDRIRQIGTFKLTIPRADPYGYSLMDNSGEDWMWDPLDFEYGKIDDPIQLTLTPEAPSASCTIPASVMPFVASIRASNIGSAGLSMTVFGDRYSLKEGENQMADFLVCQQDTEITFNGVGKVQVIYRKRVI